MRGDPLIYPIAKGKITPPCLIGIEETEIGRAHSTGEHAKQRFWTVVLSIKSAQERGSLNFSGPGSCFRSSSGQFCDPAKSCWELKWPKNIVLGIQVARFVGEEMHFWSSSCRGKACWKFKWPVLSSKSSFWEFKWPVHRLEKSF